MVVDRCPCTECLGIEVGVSRSTIHRHKELWGEATEYALREAEIQRAAAAATAAGQPIPTGSVEDLSAHDLSLEPNEYVLPTPSPCNSVHREDDEEYQDEEPSEDDDPFYEDVRDTARSLASGAKCSLRLYVYPITAIYFVFRAACIPRAVSCLVAYYALCL